MIRSRSDGGCESLGVPKWSIIKTAKEKGAWKREKPRQQGARYYAPDLERFVTLEDGDLWFHEKVGDAGRRLTEDGGKDVFWRVDSDWWSPDGLRLIGQHGDASEVHHIPIVDY